MDNAIRINHKTMPNISMKMMPGHFVTSHSHINYYLDMTTLKIRQSEAMSVAHCIAQNYSYSTIVDTIVCMDGTQVIGAYLASELKDAGIMSINRHQTIYVVTPEINAQQQMIFRDNIRIAIENKHVLLLLATATTGKTVSGSLECIQYYGGQVAGVSALFSAAREVNGYPIQAVFTEEDVPQYQTYSSHDCPMCRSSQKIDALVNSFGYSAL